MTIMADSRTCAKCGATLIAESALDVCPRCVAAQALSPHTSPAGSDANAAQLNTIALDCGGVEVEQAGGRIGRYKLREKVGEGGCGVVYVAEQEEPVRRRVALKVIKLGMDTRAVVARFEAERQALAMMDHPNIAKVLDAGATANGRPYFVMELVRGIRITDYCDENKLDTQQRLDLFIQVCHAVQHAHQKGIIHRDLKPSNILVTINDGVPVPKVIDFGIAKATEGRLTDKTVYTQLHQFIGTPAYMSPEQALMTSLDIDTRSDIYSLGVLLYELLTGRTPLDTPELLKAGVDEMRRTIREIEPARPSTRLSTLAREELTSAASRRSTNPPQLLNAVSGDLDWIVMKCLEKDRTRRYETANGLAADLKRHLNSEPVVARPPSAAYRFQKMVRRNKLVFTATSAVIAALIIGLGISTWMFIKENQARQRAVAAENKATSESSKSRHVAQFLQEMLNGVGPSVALGRDTKMLREILDNTAERVGRDLKEQPEVEVELRNTIGRVYFALGEFQKAAAMHRAALTLAQKVFGEEHLVVAGTLNDLGLALDYVAMKQTSNYAESEASLTKATTLMRRLLPAPHPDLAESIHNLAHVIADQGRSAEAELLWTEALAMRRKLFGNEHPGVADTLVYLAQMHRMQGRLSEAEATHAAALAMRRRLFGNEHPDVAHSLSHLSSLYWVQGDPTKAETAVREALAIQRKFLSADHHHMRDSVQKLGQWLQSQGKWNEAETLLREALAVSKQQLGDVHPEVASTQGRLASVLRARGELAEAEAAARETITSYRRLVKAQPGRADFREQLGHNLWEFGAVLTDTGRREQAEQALNEALEVFVKAAQDFPEKRFLRQEQAYSLRLLGRLVADLGRVDEAEQHYRKAIAGYEALKTEVPSEIWYWNHQTYASLILAQILGRAKRLYPAIAQYRQTIAHFEKAIEVFPDVTDFKSGLALAQIGLAASLHEQGKLAEAKQLYSATRKRLSSLGPDESTILMQAVGLLAELLFRNRESAELDRIFDTLTSWEASDPVLAARLFHLRGSLHARSGRWSEAVRDFRKAIELQPDEHEFYHALAPALLQSGDVEGYHQLRSDILKRFGAAQDPPTAERMAKDCLILPLPTSELETVARMAERAVTVGAGHPFESWFKHAKSLAEYRQQHFAEAVKLAQTDGDAERKVQAYAVLAMAHHHLRQVNDAGAALTNAMKIAETRLPKPESGDLGGLWNDWVIARALLREAKELIGGHSKPVSPTESKLSDTAEVRP